MLGSHYFDIPYRVVVGHRPCVLGASILASLLNPQKKVAD
jgi:hypothetical protein